MQAAARVIAAVNKQLPSPAIYVREGDIVVVHVINNSPYNVTVHLYVSIILSW